MDNDRKPGIDPLGKQTKATLVDDDRVGAIVSNSIQQRIVTPSVGERPIRYGVIQWNKKRGASPPLRSRARRRDRPVLFILHSPSVRQTDRSPEFDGYHICPNTLALSRQACGPHRSILLYQPLQFKGRTASAGGVSGGSERICDVGLKSRQSAP